MVLLLVLALLQAQSEQRPRNQPGWPCVVGASVDPSYVRIAEGTGGQVFPFDKSEVAQSSVLMIGKYRHEEVLFRASGSLGGKTREYEFPVDSTVESLFLSISVQCLSSITVLRPSGGAVITPSGSIEDHRFRAGRILTIPSPEPGPWRIRISGSGMFFVVAHAKSEISLDKVRLVQWGGRPGHEGYFPVAGPPRLGVQQMLEAELSGEITFARFRLMSSAGELLGELPLEGDGHEFLGPITPTLPAFRIVVEGLDANGLPFQRAHPPLWEPVR